MKLKEIERPAVQVWSPASQYPVYLATGMVILWTRSQGKYIGPGKLNVQNSLLNIRESFRAMGLAHSKARGC